MTALPPCFDPDSVLAMNRTLARLAASGMRMGVAANEVIWRRSLMMAFGAMSGAEAARMVLEKPAAFALAVERAGRAAARGASAPRILEEALRPVSVKARANARRLRR